MEVDLQIAYVIIRDLAVNQGAPISYSELSRRYEQATGDWVDHHLGWSAPLLAILEWCNDNHLPQLPALVVSSGENEGELAGLPGRGFWGQRNTPPAASLEAWIPLCNAVYAARWPEQMS